MRKFFFYFVITVSAVSPVATAGNLPLETAREAGVESCIGAIEAVTNAVLQGAQEHAAHSLWNNEEVDSRPYTAFIVKDNGSGFYTHISMMAGKDASGKCFAEYNHLMVLPGSCSALEGQVRNGGQEAQQIGLLGGKTIVMRDNMDKLLYLTPQDNDRQCLLQIREVIYY